MSARAVLSHLGLKRSRAYLVNGVLMLAAFLACRVLVYPAFFVAYAAQRGIPYSEALARQDEPEFHYSKLRNIANSDYSD